VPSEIQPVQNGAHPERQKQDDQQRIDAHADGPRPLLHIRDMGTGNPSGNVTRLKKSYSVAKITQLRQTHPSYARDCSMFRASVTSNPQWDYR
jgi:hypothetical protein